MEEKQLNILLVEDDVTLVKMYSSKLRKDGYRVSTAFTGNEAIELLQKEVPDLILLDIMLPDIPGLQVLEQVKKDRKLRNIPVVILTVLPEIIALNKAIKLGASGYLIKSENTPENVSQYIRAELSKSNNKNGG